MAVEQKSARWFAVLLGCTTLCPASIAAADGAPKATLTLPIAQRCRGACSPSIVPLQNGNAMVTWSNAELGFWAQAVDLKSGRLLRASGPIPDARAPAAWTLERERALVRCTAPEFQGLRDALTAFCTDSATKPTKGQGYRAYCERTEPVSLLSQAINCSDTTTKCGPVPLARVPAVDRAEYESGKRVELNYMNCSVWFSRDAKGWRVVDRECAGD